MAKCKFCNKEIVWMKEGRKNVPVEVDGAKHECEIFLNSKKSTKTIERTALSPEEIAKYEAAINTANNNKNKKK